jgi:protein-S-isoprenylcysteine O-methyltransferase Ste14
MIPSMMIILLSVAGYGLVHSLLASLWVKAQARRLFGPAADRLYRLVYNGIAVVTFLPLMALLVALPGRTLYRLQPPWSWMALGIQFLAFLTLALGVLQTGAGSFLGLRQLTGPIETAAPRLVISGLYRFVRHPLYTAGLAFIWATPVMNTNLLAFYTGLTVYIVVGTLHEEYRLRREFGEAYKAYCRRTPMLIPFRFGSVRRAIFWRHSKKI